MTQAFYRKYRSNRIKVNLPTEKAAGITKDSFVQTEVILTLPRSLISKIFGKMPESAMREIEERIKVSLAFK